MGLDASEGLRAHWQQQGLVIGGSLGQQLLLAQVVLILRQDAAHVGMGLGFALGFSWLQFGLGSGQGTEAVQTPRLVTQRHTGW